MFAGINVEQHIPLIEIGAFLAALVALWATFRPSMVRDYDNRKLPANPTARIMFIGICLLTYVVLVVILFWFKDLAQFIGSIVPIPLSWLAAFRTQAPLLAALAMMGLMQLSMFRDLERQLLVWLHSAGTLHQDGVALSTHLTRCEFVPTEDERRLNRELAKRYGVHVTSDFDSVGVVTFHSWRKVATLLRLVRSWNPIDSDDISEHDRKHLVELETAHQRKTQLAMTIVKLFEKADRGGPSSTSLTEIMALLANTREVDESKLQEIETRVRSLLSDPSQASQARPLRLTGEEFRTYLAQIEGYFQIEYDILLEEIAALTSRSVVLSGDDAPDRLDTLRQLGFGGLGKIESINFNRTLWIFLSVFLGGFLVLFVFYGLRQGTDANAPSVDMYARFAFIIALASLVGAFAGSKRSLSRASQTPWGAFMLAGLVAVGINLAVHSVWDFAKYPKQMLAANAEGKYTVAGAPDGTASPQPAETQQAASPAKGPVPTGRKLVWSILPFLLVVAICRLARLPRWLAVPRETMAGNIAERALDGLVLSSVMLISFYLAVGAQYTFGIPLSPAIKQALEPGGYYGFSMAYPMILMGFVIGVFVVRDVRRAAHAHIIDHSARAMPGSVIIPEPRVAEGQTADVHPSESAAPAARVLPFPA